MRGSVNPYVPGTKFGPFRVGDDGRTYSVTQTSFRQKYGYLSQAYNMEC